MASSEATVLEKASRADDAARQFRRLIVLGTLASTVSFLDRSILNILAEPIKTALGFSDAALGALTGLAFALFYAVGGLPIARYVDRPTTRRPLVIAACMAVWSAMTVASGFAVSYVQLFVARTLVAAGEGGVGPAIMTMIEQSVAPGMRSRVFSLYGLGGPLGTLLGLMLGGWLADTVGWRGAYIIVGAPGLLLALQIWATLRDPRSRSDAPPLSAEPHPTATENLAALARSPALRWLAAAMIAGGLFVVGLPTWTGVYLIRVLGLTPTRAGLVLGLTMGLAGVVGTFVGGMVGDRISRKDPGRVLWVPAAALLLGVPAGVMAFLTHDWRVFAAVYWIPVMGSAAYFGPAFGSLQRLAPDRHRASITMMVILAGNLLSAGAAPFLIGVASDVLRPAYGIESLRDILVACQVFAIVPAVLYAVAGRVTSRTHREP